jgi:Protein of unknown function (DUF3294)
MNPPPAVADPDANQLLDVAFAGAPDILAAIQNINRSIANPTITVNNMAVRQENSQLRSGEDFIRPVTDADAVVPPNFPNTFADFVNLPTPAVQTMLQFYGLPITPVVTQEQRLRQHCGLWK